ncbi:MAG TPA: phosphate ABC transporter substrate-binding protein PstS, partial [Limnochordia bacterium]|nr:phosphate ABC transporter substrate-binding protein PstS [Limnochordia bacterium]
MYKQAQFKYRRMVGRVSLGIAVAGLIAASTHSPFGGEIDAADTIHLNGGGSTFAQPFYSLWIDTYQKARPNVKLNYQGIGSGGGIKAVQAGTLDWGGTDAPMTDDEQAASKVGHVLNLPVAIGPVVVSYNLPGVGAGLNLSRQALVDIYLGKVTRWNDSEITDANPGKALPNLPIAVVHRSDASGTSYIFTDY